MKKILLHSAMLIGLALSVSNCDKERGFIIMPLSQEVDLGEQLDSTIRANPSEYPVLDPSQNAAAYAYLQTIVDDILDNTEEPLKYKDKFDWKLTIINKNELNAFAAPGGYLYFYTGLLKYLDNASNVAGVMGHEMAHADLRHAAQQMQKAYGVNFAASILFGTDKSQLEQILSDVGSGLASLQFSREDEYQADAFSVRYLAGTEALSNNYDAKYDPRGVAGFFEKLEGEGKEGESWEFLSTHPSGSNRVDEIDKVWQSLGSPTGQTFDSEYQSFKALLP
ncbi:MAG: M48 family metalloprotease [Bacteroidota bacterium]|nr:MAG: M48 family metalloprotease [Bacteroidota bacterium]